MEEEKGFTWLTISGNNSSSLRSQDKILKLIIKKKKRSQDKHSNSPVLSPIVKNKEQGFLVDCSHPAVFSLMLFRSPLPREWYCHREVGLPSSMDSHDNPPTDMATG